MNLLVFVLHNHEKLDAVLTELERAGICGATVIDSTGMAKVLHHEEEDVMLLGALRNFLNGASRTKSNTIFTIIPTEQLQPAVEAFERIVGDLDQQNVGIAFSLPVDYVKGVRLS
jgi:hypothetical protein